MAPDELPAFRRVVVVMATVAPVVLTSITGRPSGLVSWRSGPFSFTLGWDGRGHPAAELTEGDDTRVLSGPAPLVAGRFTMLGLVLTPDDVALWCGGGEVDRAPWAGEPSRPDGPGIVVGSRVDSAVVDSMFHTEAATGVVTELRLGTANDIALLSVPDAIESPVCDIDPIEWLAARVGADPERPRYHFVAPGHWMNEPHAPIEVDGTHHVFYQSNRRGPFWGGIEWGHAVSRDLVHWQHLAPAVLRAVGTPAPTGIWSGSSVLDDDGDVLLYVTAGDASRDPDQSVAIARPNGTGSWTLEPRPLVEMPAVHPLDPGLRLVPGQFRDPFVWREDATWFMLVGAGIVGRGGAALLYSSPDGVTWTSELPLLVGDRASGPDTGEMWELPVLLPVSGADGKARHALLVSSWWERPPAGERANVWTWVGAWDAADGRFTPEHLEPRLVDVGQHFTGPSGYVASDGRTVVWSIAQDGRLPALMSATGWAHNAGLPVELTSDTDGRLAITPVRELAALRAETLVRIDAPLAPVAATLLEFDGLQLEVELSARCGRAGAVEIGLRTDASGNASGVLRIASESVTLRRPGAAAYDRWCPDEVHELPVDSSPVVDVRVFVDGSMLEVYAAGRGLTSRMRASADADRLTIRVDGEAEIGRLAVWRLDPTAEAAHQ